MLQIYFRNQQQFMFDKQTMSIWDLADFEDQVGILITIACGQTYLAICYIDTYQTIE